MMSYTSKREQLTFAYIYTVESEYSSLSPRTEKEQYTIVQSSTFVRDAALRLQHIFFILLQLGTFQLGHALLASLLTRLCLSVVCCTVSFHAQQAPMLLIFLIFFISLNSAHSPLLSTSATIFPPLVFSNLLTSVFSPICFHYLFLRFCVIASPMLQHTPLPHSFTFLLIFLIFLTHLHIHGVIFLPGRI